MTTDPDDEYHARRELKDDYNRRYLNDLAQRELDSTWE